MARPGVEGDGLPNLPDLIGEHYAPLYHAAKKIEAAAGRKAAISMLVNVLADIVATEAAGDQSAILYCINGVASNIIQACNDPTACDCEVCLAYRRVERGHLDA